MACRLFNILCKSQHFALSSRAASTLPQKSGVVIGIYEGEEVHSLTPAAITVNELSEGNLRKLLHHVGPIKPGAARVLYGVSAQYPVVAVVGLGDRDNTVQDVLERRDDAREAVRAAAAAGYRSLCEAEVGSVSVDGLGDAEAAAEGATLASFKYQQMKTVKKHRPAVQCFSEEEPKEWSRGSILARGQNIARSLMETPANVLTPTQFAQEAVTELEPLGVEVLVRGYEWAKQRNMGAFLSVTRGSIEPPIFLELSYKGAQYGEAPLALVGKGVTFDTGGISLKPPKGMEEMRADMGGAACVVGAMHSIAALRLPINVKGYIPLCENMPSGAATKPGDVVTASNGKTVQIDNTDAEGRLILADALVYACQGKPRAVVDLATLTGAMRVALGSGAAGTFSNSDALWGALETAGHTTGDRLWRMPLWKLYAQKVTEYGYADVHNIGKGDGKAGACTAASFLQQFVSCSHWAHIDIAGVMDNADDVPYLGNGMSGRPTRTLAQFAALLASNGAKL